MVKLPSTSKPEIAASPGSGPGLKAHLAMTEKI